MAIIEQCRKCRRNLSDCPYYVQEEVKPCKNYMYPIDNSTFFSNFLSRKGRIGKTQYQVIGLISLCVLFLCMYLASIIVGFLMAYNINIFVCVIIFFLIITPPFIIISFAKKRRCNDLGTSSRYTTFKESIFNNGEDGINENGTEPLKPYAPQVEWREE